MILLSLYGAFTEPERLRAWATQVCHGGVLPRQLGGNDLIVTAGLAPGPDSDSTGSNIDVFDSWRSLELFWMRQSRSIQTYSMNFHDIFIYIPWHFHSLHTAILSPVTFSSQVTSRAHGIAPGADATANVQPGDDFSRYFFGWKKTDLNRLRTRSIAFYHFFF